MPEREELINKIKLSLIKRNLQCTQWFIDKIIQVYEMVLVRHGLMIVGESFSGKTCAYQVYIITFMLICMINIQIILLFVNLRYIRYLGKSYHDLKINSIF